MKVQKLNEIENCQIRSQVGDKLHVYYIGQLEDETIFDMRRRQGRNDKVKASKKRVSMAHVSWSLDVKLEKLRSWKERSIFPNTLPNYTHASHGP